MWAYIFCLSKLPELFDTYFVVLRKQKLILLHWYHHITVMVYCYFHVAYMVVPGQWFVVMNYFVHSIMYCYYAMRASRLFTLPRWLMMVITVLQLSQMAVGVGINIYIYRMMSTVPDFYCDERIETSYFYVYCAFAMYLSYFILFLHFFYTTYIKNGGANVRKASDVCATTSKEPDKQKDHRENGDVVAPTGNGALYRRKWMHTSVHISILYSISSTIALVLTVWSWAPSTVTIVVSFLSNCLRCCILCSNCFISIVPIGMSSYMWMQRTRSVWPGACMLSGSGSYTCQTR